MKRDVQMGILVAVLTLLVLAAGIAAAATWPANPPTLPAKGGTFADPSWGTLMMRITDASDGKDNTVAYSYWPTFAKDNLHFFIACAGVPYLYHLDPVGFHLVGNKTPLFASYPPGETRNPGWQDTIWSGINANEVLCHGRYLKLYSYNVETGAWTTLHDFAGQTTAYSLWQMSRSLDDDVFAFTLTASNGSKVGYMVWKRSTNQILLQVMDATGLDEVQLDKTGRYLLAKKASGGYESYVYDLQLGTSTGLTDGAPDYGPGHSDNGTGTCFGAENWLNRELLRSLAMPHQFTVMLDHGNDWSQDLHTSFLADNETMALLSSYDYGHFQSPDNYLRQEVYQVVLDGTQTVHHICHHYTNAGRNYWGSPRANISRNGQFVAFTSNWGGQQRDVFIAKVF